MNNRSMNKVEEVVGSSSAQVVDQQSNIQQSDENMESQRSPIFSISKYQEYREAIVINLLKKSGGSMEVSDLVLSLGISDSQAQHNLNDLLSESPSIGTKGEQIFLVEEVVQQGQQQQSLALEPTKQAAFEVIRSSQNFWKTQTHVLNIGLWLHLQYEEEKEEKQQEKKKQQQQQQQIEGCQNEEDQMDGVLATGEGTSRQ